MLNLEEMSFMDESKEGVKNTLKSVKNVLHTYTLFREASYFAISITIDTVISDRFEKCPSK